MRLAVAFALALAAALPAPSAARAQEPVQTTSRAGKPLRALPDTGGALALADAMVARHPRDVDTLLAAAALKAGAWRYTDAIALYSRAAQLAPNDPRPYRFRGHRYISLRRFDDAVRDLERGFRLDSMSYDIAYHLGLALYMRGDFAAAARVYDRCFAQARNPAALAMDTTARRGFKACTTIAADDDDRVGISEWYYRALRRAGRHDDAKRLVDGIGEGLRMRSSGAYYADLLVSKGVFDEAPLLDSLRGNELQWLTVAYGLGVRKLAAGDTTAALHLFGEIASKEYWPAFGLIGAEVEVERLQGRKGRKR